MIDRNTPDSLKPGILTMQGELAIKIIRKDGTIEDHGVVSKRLVTVEYVEFLVDCLQSSDSTFSDFKYHISGTGINVEANTNVQLQTAIGTARAVGSQEEGLTANIYKSVATITYGAIHDITEHGIFNEQYVDAQDNGILMDRSVFAAKNVESGDAIQFTYTLTVNAET